MEVFTQTNTYELRKKVATDKRYILRKRSLKFQNPMFDILHKIAC